ncbi:papilin b, proteoglycan-like sulfated glycoprotein [Salminus brasiliensis]|uniref:papilin b, proteoglycan-like sulfated glycoprotein n=1 Tax=Salminus brasiliensis TaxID=930266 RepID=UPI003B82C819
MILLSLLGVLYLLTAPVFSVRQPSDDHWGEYGPYGECSRTCGTGVAVRTRVCNTMRTDGGHNCVGPSKSYKSCNTQECPSGSRDFREEQCSQFDRMDFQGKRYTWQPYYGAPNPCELVCVPRGENFYYRHRPAVVDGTPCYVGRNDICVEGACRALSHGEIVGFDHTTPTSVSRAPRPGVTYTTEAYRYSFGTYSECSAPCGGGMQTRSVSCVLDGHVVDDSHCVSQGLQRPPAQRACNQHACAEYSVGSFSSCSVTCGEGQQVREVFCVGGRGERLPEHQCSGLSRPAEVRTCQKPACHQVFQYHINDWSLCTRSCGTGTRTRRVVCMDRDQNQYGDERCSPQSKPHTVENCNTQPCPGAQTVPSVQDPRGHESSLRGFVPHTYSESSSVHTPYEPYAPVVGPHCAQSYYGCCPDGHTAASGPRGEGCADDCIRSRYGCCLDGVTAAQGFARAGCPEYTNRDYPSVHTDVCSMPRDVGTCYEYKSRFYFDASARTCTQFWYGGCQGNGNNFASVEECRRTCGESTRVSAPAQSYRDPAPRRVYRGRYRARA